MLIDRFRKERDGSVAVLSGGFLLLVTLVAGGAVDLTAAMKNRSELQRALDSAAISAATRQLDTQDARLEYARNFLQSTPFCQASNCKDINARMDGNALALSASVTTKTMLLHVFGSGAIDVDGESRAIASTTQGVEVAMMLDFSGSMGWFNKYQDMATAAVGFIDQAEEKQVKVAVAPFAKYLLTPMGGQYMFDLAAGAPLGVGPAVGCILNREYPHSTSVETPNQAEEGSLWPVMSYVLGADPESGTYQGRESGVSGDPWFFTYEGVDYHYESIDTQPNSSNTSVTVSPVDDWSDGAIFDGNSEIAIRFITPPSLKFQLKNIAPWPAEPASDYEGYAGSGGWSDGGDPASLLLDIHKLAEQLDPECADYVNRKLWVRPFSDDYAGLRMAIQTMEPGGATNVALALDIGWHLLSPNAPFNEGAEATKKIAILLTDGVQTVKAHGPGNEIGIDAANNVIAETCEAMKADGVEMFTIAFGIEHKLTRDMLKACATGEPQYYEPMRGDELKGVFDGIFQQISTGKARITG